jgi:ABC-type phosphate transport system permease subunit
MNISSVILGLLVGLLAPVLVVAIMAAALIVSFAQNVATQVARNTRKASSAHACSSWDAKVIKIPTERSSVQELRPAA